MPLFRDQREKSGLMYRGSFYGTGVHVFSGGGFIGFFDEYPDAWTDGKDSKELEEMLESLYEDFNDILSGEDTKSTFRPDILCHSVIKIPLPV
jgi:hypothetical protein